MLDRALPLLRVFSVILVLAIVALLGLLVWFLVFGQNDGAPRTELERGLAAAEEAVKADPENANARIKLAAAYLEQKRYSSAIEQTEIAARLNPDDPTPYYVVGVAKDATGDAAGAVVSLKTAVGMKGQLAAFYQDAYAALAHAQERTGDAGGALESINEAIDLGPENAILLFERGQIYERRGEFAFALQDYAWALSYVPDYEPALTAYNDLSAAHPEALDEIRQQQESENDETTETAGGS